MARLDEPQQPMKPRIRIKSPARIHSAQSRPRPTPLITDYASL